jgi:hypothetical protein
MASGASFRLVDRACHFCGVRRQCLKWCVSQPVRGPRRRPACPSTQRVFVCFSSASRLCQLVLAHLRTLLVLGVSAEHLCGFAARYHHLSAHMVHNFLPSSRFQIFSLQIFSHKAPGTELSLPVTANINVSVLTDILYFILRVQVLRRVQLDMSVSGVCTESISTDEGGRCVRR